MEVCNRFISIRSSSTFFFRSQIHKSIKLTSVKSKSSQDKIRVLKELKKETEETLEWQSICSSVSRFTSTSMGSSVSRSGNLPFGRDREESQKLLDQTTAAVLLPQPLDFSGIEDLSEIVGSAVSGELLTVRQLCAVARSLQSARGVLEQLEKMSSENQGDSQR